jgi:hypothetical protein
MDTTMNNGILPPEIDYWIKDKLQYFKSISGHGTLEIIIQDGYPITYRDTYSHKVSGRSRYRTKPTIK